MKCKLYVHLNLCRQQQLTTALHSLDMANEFAKVVSDNNTELLITTANTWLAMADFNKSLRYWTFGLWI